MTTLQFQAKPVDLQILPSLDMVEGVRLPQQWKRSHVIKPGKLGPYINSDMIAGAVAREIKRNEIPPAINVDNPPEGITVERGSLLATITITLD